MASPAHLIVVRHGETDWNLARRLQGQLHDEPEVPRLTSRGLQQAAITAAHLAVLQSSTSSSRPAIAAIYSSDLERATAVRARDSG